MRTRLLDRFTVSRAAIAAGLILAGALSGCSGHGQYTSEHAATAADKVAQIKSATSWTTAQQQFVAGDLDKALKSVDESIALNGKVAKSHLLRGRILIEKGDLDAARLALLEAEKLDPKSAEPEYYLGILHERFREPEPALERYSKAFDLDSTNAQYLIAWAEMLIQLDRLDDADALLAEHVPQFQYNPALRQTQGHIALLRNDPAKANQLFGEARLLAPDDMTVLEDLVHAQIASEDYADAEFNISKLQDAYKATPGAKGATRRDLQHLRARCLVHLDRPVEARTVLLDLTSGREGESDVQAWIELGDVAALLNDGARMKEAAARVMAMAPQAYEGYYLRALWLHRQGDNTGALKALDKALACGNAANDPGPFVLQGLVWQDLGDNGKAKVSFESAAKLAPENKQIQTLLTAAETP